LLPRIGDGAVFEANLGLSERQKSALYARGASIMPLPLRSSPLFPNNEQLEHLFPFSEAQVDLTYRFLDLEETLETVHEIITLLGQDGGVPLLEAEYERLKEMADHDQQACCEQIVKMANGDICEWMSWEFPEELDHLHRQICHLTVLTYGMHHCWINQLEKLVDASV
jgi:hypothetical protein